MDKVKYTGVHNWYYNLGVHRPNIPKKECELGLTLDEVNKGKPIHDSFDKLVLTNGCITDTRGSISNNISSIRDILDKNGIINRNIQLGASGCKIINNKVLEISIGSLHYRVMQAEDLSYIIFDINSTNKLYKVKDLIFIPKNRGNSLESLDLDNISGLIGVGYYGLLLFNTPKTEDTEAESYLNYINKPLTTNYAVLNSHKIHEYEKEHSIENWGIREVLTATPREILTSTPADIEMFRLRRKLLEKEQMINGEYIKDNIYVEENNYEVKREYLEKSIEKSEYTDNFEEEDFEVEDESTELKIEDIGIDIEGFDLEFEFDEDFVTIEDFEFEDTFNLIFDTSFLDFNLFTFNFNYQAYNVQYIQYDNIDSIWVLKDRLLHLFNNLQIEQLNYLVSQYNKYLAESTLIEALDIINNNVWRDNNEFMDKLLNTLSVTELALRQSDKSLGLISVNKLNFKELSTNLNRLIDKYKIEELRLLLQESKAFIIGDILASNLSERQLDKITIQRINDRLYIQPIKCRVEYLIYNELRKHKIIENIPWQMIDSRLKKLLNKLVIESNIQKDKVIIITQNYLITASIPLAVKSYGEACIKLYYEWERVYYANLEKERRVERINDAIRDNISDTTDKENRVKYRLPIFDRGRYEPVRNRDKPEEKEDIPLLIFDIENISKLDTLNNRQYKPLISLKRAKRVDIINGITRYLEDKLGNKVDDNIDVNELLNDGSKFNTQLVDIECTMHEDRIASLISIDKRLSKYSKENKDKIMRHLLNMLCTDSEKVWIIERLGIN